MSDRGGGKSRKPVRRTQAEVLARQRAISEDRTVRNMTWAAIADKHGMGEKEARESYRRYAKDILPLITDQKPLETVLQYLATLEALRAELAAVSAQARNDSARVGALREIRNTLAKEIELLQHAGQIPSNLGDRRARAEQERLANAIVEVLRRHGVAQHISDEIAEAIVQAGGQS